MHKALSSMPAWAVWGVRGLCFEHLQNVLFRVLASILAHLPPAPLPHDCFSVQISRNKIEFACHGLTWQVRRQKSARDDNHQRQCHKTSKQHNTRREETALGGNNSTGTLNYEGKLKKLSCFFSPNYSNYFKLCQEHKIPLRLRYSSMVEHMPDTCKALGSIHSS